MFLQLLPHWYAANTHTHTKTVQSIQCTFAHKAWHFYFDRVLIKRIQWFFYLFQQKWACKFSNFVLFLFVVCHRKINKEFWFKVITNTIEYHCDIYELLCKKVKEKEKERESGKHYIDNNWAPLFNRDCCVTIWRCNQYHQVKFEHNQFFVNDIKFKYRFFLWILNCHALLILHVQNGKNHLIWTELLKYIIKIVKLHLKLYNLEILCSVVIQLKQVHLVCIRPLIFNAQRSIK